MEEAKTWGALLQAADRRIISDFPFLEQSPAYQRSFSSTTTSSSRLYNCIAPLNDSSIVFLGRGHLSNSFRVAEAQAIWATAYFDGSISLPPPKQAERQVAYMSAFSKRRYPSRGSAGDFFFYESTWYTDRLIEEVGLKSHRGKGWWWDDWLEPCLASDYKDMVMEYRQKYKV